MRLDCVTEIEKWLMYLPVYGFPNQEILEILELFLKDSVIIKIFIMWRLYNFIKFF